MSAATGNPKSAGIPTASTARIPACEDLPFTTSKSNSLPARNMNMIKAT